MVPYPAPPPQRPGTALKVLGIIEIVFGSISLVFAPIGLLITMFNSASRDPLQRKLHDLLWEGPMAAWSYAQPALGFVLAALLLAGGIGLVRGRMWGRTASLVYAIGSLVLNLAGQAVMAAVVYPMLMDQMNSTSPVMRAGAVGGIAGGIGGALFAAILPIVALAMLLRKTAREQLA